MQWWYFMGIILDYAYEKKLHSNFYCLYQKPPPIYEGVTKQFTKTKRLNTN